MATEVNQTFFAWSQGEPADMGVSQGVPVSQALNHGSISFGRFELESLSWEKWSVFTNDSRSEEFGKFNGLVAQKKAYFEEYYKRIRELKASQQQIQQTELTLEYSGDGSDSSQTGEDMQAEDLETPTGSGTIVYDDYVEETTHETTSEQGMQCYHDHEEEDFHTEFSSSNLVSAAVISQQTDKDTRENARGDNSDSVDTANASLGHEVIGAAYENAKAPKRIIGKDPRLRYASMIIPKSVKTVPGSPLDRTSVSNKRPASVKSSLTLNQKTKTDNVRSANVTPQKTGCTALTRKPTTKEAPEVTGVRRPSSASARVPSLGERHPITRASVKKPAEVSTPRRPSSSERRPITRERAQKQSTVTTPCRPSTSERRPVSRGGAAKHADIATTRRPSTGERRPITRDSVQKMDPRTSSKTRSSVDHPVVTTASMGILKKATSPNVTKSTRPEPKSNIRGSKDSSTVVSHLTRPKRIDLQVSGKQKSRSVNFPPSKMLSSSVGEPTFATLKKREGIQGTVQSRASASKKATPWQPRNTKPRAPNPPTPPPPPHRTSRTTNKPSTGNSSVGGRKPKPSAQQWH